MSEHDKLKEICDKIGYKTNKQIFYFGGFMKKTEDQSIEINVREIIFTQEFMDKLNKHILIDSLDLSELILKQLDNPTDYLYNLIK